MSFIRLSITTVVLGALAVGGILLAENRGWLAVGSGSQWLGQAQQRLSQITIPASLATLQSSQIAQSLATQSASLLQSGVVLGAETALDSVQRQQPPLSQRAFEFARYNYCQAVVDEYQKRY